MKRAPLLPPRVLAVLGPTNTGKTHYAVERLLAHESGMIGFPLRLLAREIYDRIVAIKGPGQVALFTGEEKIGKESARYIVATVEAMPMHRQVAFLAVDEIQLCGDRERGHIFTDRLLNARGYGETMFLGSDTIRPLIRRLVPEAEIVTRPRFSVLAHDGAAKLHRLPRRSAIVAFRASDVYTLAEIVRRQRGGAAVVLGALSPRTRNAQVALYQSGEVDHLVATDAIGMGLNMDLTHVAFAELTKFDGRLKRRLEAAEVAQIAGRAGRHMANGTFGTTNACEPLDPRIVEAVENHQFPPLKQLHWRNSELDFRSLDALAASLDAPPPVPGLVKVRDALDDRSLGMLSRRDEVRARATDRDGVHLLWQVCQIPDFRKTLTEAHLHLLATVFRHLTEGRGLLPADWLAGMIARLDRTDGDIDTLAGRIAHIRTMTYLSQREAWLADPAHWQGVARAVEDRLSDALHERLTQKFVDRRTAALMRSLREQADMPGTVGESGEIHVDGHEVGRMDGFTFTPVAASVDIERRVLQAAARPMIREVAATRARELGEAGDKTLAIEGETILWQDAPVGWLRAGTSLLRPRVELVAGATDSLPAPARAGVRERLERFLASWRQRHLGALLALEAAAGDAATGAAARGLAFRLVERFGNLPADEVREQVGALEPADRRKLSRLGLRFGVFSLFVPAMLRPGAVRALSTLRSIFEGAPLVLPPPGRVVLRGEEIPEDETQLALFGYRRAGPVALRLDIAERLAAMLRAAARAGAAVPLPPAAMAVAGLTREEVAGLGPALGFSIRLEEDGIMLSRARKGRHPKRAGRAARKSEPKREPPPPADSPFAVLAALKARP